MTAISKHGVALLCALGIGLAVAAVAPPLAALEGPPRASMPQATTYRGADAQAFVADLLRTNARFAAAQARSATILRGYGLRKTDNVLVQVVKNQVRVKLVHLLGQLAAKFYPSLYAQEYDVDGGYAIFTSWDDGDDSTWEGDVYVYDADDDASADIEVQLDVSGTNGSGSDNPPAIVQDYGGSIGDATHGPYEMSPAVLLTPPTGLGAVLRVGAPTRRAALTAEPAPSRADCACGLLDLHGHQLMNCFTTHTLDNAWPWCAGAALGCIFSGPAYFQCVAATCATAIAAYMIGQMKSFWQACMMSPGARARPQVEGRAPERRRFVPRSPD